MTPPPRTPRVPGRLAALPIAAAILFAAALAGAKPGDPGDSRRSAIVVAAQRVSPAVVTVGVVQTRVVRTDPFGGMMHDEFFDRFFPRSEYRQKVPSMGSGVIVDPSGIVLTNSHVIRQADEIKVTLPDGRSFGAKVLGDSPVYDLAVLKIDGTKLPSAVLGNSDSLVVGEWAIAIGNPFGMLLEDTQPTVTAGVISATRRDIKSEATDASGGGTGIYKNMIQTDAAINPGNSGGALVNGDGEVIGINTFIFTSGGGSIGLGFAIPINMAKSLLAEIRRYGRVRQAWPGMQVQPVTELLARRLGWSDVAGLVVTRVDPAGPAARTGVRPGDRIRRVNGRITNTVDDVQASIYGARVGDDLVLEIERDGRPMTLRVPLEEAPR
ncbi:MAG: trypsin-like peptidase domain-containing protein [Candidatus Eisenbacteria bacterium]|nr:trypsin-like peptidase domain-containing protein [Candidatus Eisenbacteria bacterium]